MRKFLRLFPQFRNMEAAFQEYIDSEAKQLLGAKKSGYLEGRAELQPDIDALRASHNEACAENLRLQDRIDAVLEDRKKLWELMEKALDGERTAFQMHVNAQWQKQYGTTPYPEAPHLPDAAVPKNEPGPVGRSGRRLPSEAVHMASMEFLRSQFPSKS